MNSKLCAPKNISIVKLASNIYVDDVVVSNLIDNRLTVNNVIVNKIGCKDG